jgi:hypothetical protein
MKHAFVSRSNDKNLVNQSFLSPGFDMAHKFTSSYLEDSIALFHYYKRLAEGAMAQVSDEQLFATLDNEMNPHCREAYDRQHAFALHRLSYF